MALAYRADIDGLRTVAVIPVVLFHAGLGFSGGFVGVDIFFVISGFLITGIIARDIEAKRFSIAHFYERRIRRLYPALFAMLLVTTLAVFLFMIPPDVEEYAGSLMASTVYGSNIFFYSQAGYFTEAAHLKPLLHTWSLSVEEQFYVFFPPFLWAVTRLIGARGAKWVLVALAAASFVLSIVWLDRNASFTFYMLPTRAWEMALGGLLALGVFPSLAGRARVAQGLGAVALLFILVPVFTYQSTTAFPGLSALWPCLGAVILIWIGKDHQTAVSRALATGPMVFIGKISYSLYLWHWPIMVFAAYGGPAKLPPIVGGVCVLLSVGAAYLSWRFIEEPVRRGRALASPRGVWIMGAALSASAMVVGGSFLFAKGFEGRLSPQLASYLDTSVLFGPRHDCHGRSPNEIANGDVCERGAPDVAPSFVLVGDSHAAALAPGLFAAAQDSELRGYQVSYPGFLPVAHIRPVGAASRQPWTEATEIFLRDRPGIKNVFITGYWEYMVDGETYRHKGIQLRDDEGNDTEKDNSVLLALGLGRFFEAFPERSFILLDDVPTGNELYLKHHMRGAQVPWRTATQGLPTEAAERQSSAYRAVLKTIADDHPNVRFVSVMERSVCCEMLCPLFSSDGGPLFRDGDHLSYEGALALRGPLADVLRGEYAN